jgi:hypothetical protein
VTDRALAFVVGTGRCGSTLVHELLAGHPQVGFFSNVDDRFPDLSDRLGLGRVNGALLRRLPPSATRKGRPRFAPSEAYRRLEARVSPLLVDPVRDLRASDATPWLRRRLGSAFADAPAPRSSTHLVHKFTGWPRARLLGEVFPEARFVHVVRDGRAVASSWLQMPWWRGHRGPEGWHFGRLGAARARRWDESGRSFTLLAGLGWATLMDSYDASCAELGPERWLEVRYEDLVADPAASLATITAFLGLPADRRFDRHVGRHRFDATRLEVWRDDLGRCDAALLTEELSVPLARRGYPTAPTTIDRGS